MGDEGQITLTAAGRDIANRLLNRHHLIERMLTEIFGLEWYKVHDEAEQLEHAVSADFERKLIEKLGAVARVPARQSGGHGFARAPPQPRTASRWTKRRPASVWSSSASSSAIASCWSIWMARESVPACRCTS